ncbi:hypothetical protein [Aequorivita marisscotiae]|uniref:Uncharacterized protein n=1 Tax=Aequorivita marisscotiae TaxID=3040348 RepID=A0ABY8KSY5_9FLAO|nr:hypothetical protein [Aequorivita sp. Ant34-E75]WGF92158.1 hypothetical protein QCQ61_13215 [Aequorivita sp. Ant34-E75]
MQYFKIVTPAASFLSKAIKTEYATTASVLVLRLAFAVANQVVTSRCKM